MERTKEEWYEHWRLEAIKSKKLTNEYVEAERLSNLPDDNFEWLDLQVANDVIRRTKDREWRNLAYDKKSYDEEIDVIKKQIVKDNGLEKSICYFYYLWNPMLYIGEAKLKDSFNSLFDAVYDQEVIVALYDTNDGTKDIAEEYGFRVLEIPKQEGYTFHMAKLLNMVYHECESNFVVDLNIHTTYPKNMHEFFINYIDKVDFTKDLFASRGYFEQKDRSVKRVYSTSLLLYKPFLKLCRGYDERTSYGKGTTHYGMSLFYDVLGLTNYNKVLDMLHSYHDDFKYKKIQDKDNQHMFSLFMGEVLIDNLLRDFENGIKNVHNSYW